MSRSLTRAEGPAIQSIDSSSYLGGRYLRKRTGDFSDTTLSAKLFNRTHMPRTSQEETVTFIDAYLENQSSKYGSISGRDVADAIESVYEGPDGP